jgi:hypothetical protein
MRKIFLIALVAVLIIVITGGYLSWTYLFPHQNETGDTTPTTIIPLMDQIADRAMAYIATNYTGAVQLMTNIPWTGGRQETGLLGTELYQFTRGDWQVQINYHVVQNPIYNINVSYCTQTDTISWTGTYNNAISETSHAINITTICISTQEQLRDSALMFIQAYHNETTPYMQSFTWTGGRMDMGMMLGSSKYSYQSSGWNVTIQYPVVLNPVYTINVDYNSPPYYQASPPVLFSWQGTLQNGTITETGYGFNP